MANILVLEKPVTRRLEFSTVLTRQGHRVVEAHNVDEFISHAAQADIAMIDLDLPDGAGYQAAQCMQDQRPQAGLVILTACGDLDHKIRGLKEYADQYLIKPIRDDELSAYMVPMVRRFGRENWRLDSSKRRLYGPDGQQDALNQHEMLLMQLLATQPQGTAATVTRRAIATAMGYDWAEYDERHLDQMVSRLRRRWQKLSGRKLPLRTERGEGYSFSEQIDILG
ncbi:response regulator transcription factor [Herbaspirillum autotrophicum]|uniref:response regulator transcription factor n=1 Tax=Herbaspirillum autotrophicum TaxID=180195 RepID=UPI00067C8214|nr:response regulator transcription factor [Herbaspirillum autotrophicum]